MHSWIVPSLTGGWVASRIRRKTPLLTNFLDSNPRQKRTLSPPDSQLNFALSRDICAGQISQPGISITYPEHRGWMPMIILQACVDVVTLSVTAFMVACGWEMCAEVFCCHFSNSHLCFHLLFLLLSCLFLGWGEAWPTQNAKKISQIQITQDNRDSHCSAAVAHGFSLNETGILSPGGEETKL